MTSANDEYFHSAVEEHKYFDSFDILDEGGIHFVSVCPGMSITNQNLSSYAGYFAIK